MTKKANSSTLIVVIQDTPKMNASRWWATLNGGRMQRKRGAKGMTKFSDHNRTNRAAVGMSTYNPIREEEEGVALNSTTGMEDRENISPETDAQRGERVWFGRGAPNFILGRPLNKEDGGPTCSWIFDSGATDTMSYDTNHFLTHDKPMKNIIKTANREGIEVEGAETISFTNNLTLKNCFFCS